jgi:hypothetical protein
MGWGSNGFRPIKWLVAAYVVTGDVKYRTGAGDPAFLFIKMTDLECFAPTFAWELYQIALSPLPS